MPGFFVKMGLKPHIQPLESVLSVNENTVPVLAQSNCLRQLTLQQPSHFKKEFTKLQSFTEVKNMHIVSACKTMLNTGEEEAGSSTSLQF